MDFGRVSNDELGSVDFKLPIDHAKTTSLLAKNKGNRSEIFVGCAKWGRKDWIGKIYPPRTKEADFLSHYSKFFNCIELNATFYKLPTKSQTQAWASKVGEDFKFCPKVTQSISHIRRLKEAQGVTDRFLEGISGFGNKLGAIFLVPHPTMGPKTFDVQQQFIESFPKDLDLFVELRQPDWFRQADTFNSFYDMLERNRVGAVITDASGRRDCVHMRLTTPEAFIRFVGNGLHPTDYTRIDDWVQRIKSWMAQGIRRVHFFMHQHEELHSPELCKYLIEQLNKHCGTTIQVPVFVDSSEVPTTIQKAVKKTVVKTARKKSA